jgi:hypothetical protein
MRKKTLLFLSIVTIVVTVSMIPGILNGTVLIPKDLKDLVIESSDIVLGKVIEMDTDWNTEKSRIYTNVVLEIEREIKGDFVAGEKVDLQTMGGSVEEVSLKVPASPSFNIDERVIVFFGGEPNVNTPITGWEQGKFTVENDIIIENGRYLDDFISEIKSLMTQQQE